MMYAATMTSEQRARPESGPKTAPSEVHASRVMRHPVTGRYMAGDCERDCLTACAGLCGVESSTDQPRHDHNGRPDNCSIDCPAYDEGKS